ncbi:MAG: type II secretion system protein GspG [Planctomycetes bacterium]|nr:type II secretion system protein GspG [Planctomycetota bacterium]
MRIPRLTYVLSIAVVATALYVYWPPSGAVLKTRKAKSDLRALAGAVQEYYNRNRELPDSLDALFAEIETSLPFGVDESDLRDPWNNPYDYNRNPDGRSFELICYGADGAAGGRGESADIVESATVIDMPASATRSASRPK